MINHGNDQCDRTSDPDAYPEDETFEIRNKSSLDDFSVIMQYKMDARQSKTDRETRNG
jgi:hypothetical protein